MEVNNREKDSEKESLRRSGGLEEKKKKKKKKAKEGEEKKTKKTKKGKKEKPR